MENNYTVFITFGLSVSAESDADAITKARRRIKKGAFNLRSDLIQIYVVEDYVVVG